MVEDISDIRDRLIAPFLGNVAFDGWSRKSLVTAVVDAGYDESMEMRAFPGGMKDVADHFADWSDRRMLKVLAELDLEGMRVRERLQACVKARLQLNAPYREAVRRLLSFLALPGNAPLALKLAWRTSSVIWYAAGDRASDWNHYSKRGLLASVYTSTILYWLADEADEQGDYPETWGFLDRRIEDVLRTFGLAGRLKSALGGLRGPFGKPG